MKSNQLTHACLAVVCLWLVAEYLFLGPASVVKTASNGEMLVPALLSQRFADDTGAFWQNITSTGADKLIFTYYSTVDTFLFSALPGWLAVSLRMSAVFIAGTLGAYALARRVFAFSRPASLFVGSAYGMSISGHLFASSIGFFPVVLLAIYGVLNNRKRFLAWGGLGVVLYIFSDTTYFSQLIPWSMGTIVFWFVFADTRTSLREWLIIIASCAALFIFRLDDFLALLANAPLSYIDLARTTPDFMESLTQAVRHPYFLAKPKSMAITALFAFALWDRVRSKNGAVDKKIWGVGLALLIGAFLFPLGVAIQTVASEILPFLKGYRMTYATRIPNTILPFAAGFGIDAMLRAITTSRNQGGAVHWRMVGWAALAVAVGTLGLTSLKAKYASLYNWVTHGSYAHNFMSPVIEDLAKTVSREPVPPRVETFQIIPNYLHAYGIETASGYQALHSRRYYEFWAKMAEPWASAIGPESRFYPQYSKRRAMTEKDLAFRDDRLWLFPDAYKSEWRLGDGYHLNFLSLANVGYFLSRERLTDPSLVPVREIPRPWSSLSAREKTAINIKANFRGREYFYIYKNTDVLPRFYTVSNITVFEGKRALLDAMTKTAPRDFRRTVFAARADLPETVALDQKFSHRAVSVIHYGKDEIRLRLGGEGAALLVGSNGYSPFWRVEIDGREGEIFPAYHAFWGVAIPDGAKSVVFRYQPPYKY